MPRTPRRDWFRIQLGKPFQTPFQGAAVWTSCATIALVAGLAIAQTTQPEAQPASEPTKEPATQEAPAATPPPSAAKSNEAQNSKDNVGREVEIVRRDRSRLRGVMISQDDKAIVLSISGLRTELPLGEVESMQVLPSVEERYALLRTSINDHDVDAILNLARWLRERERYALAHREAERVLQIEPNNATAIELKRQLEAQMKVLGQKVPAKEEATKVAPREGVDALPPAEPEEFPLLNDEQINLIRVFETDLRDPPRMIIKRKVVEAFLDKYAGTVVEGRGMVPVNPEGRKQFIAQRPATILSWFFDLRAREFYTQVQVEENPRSLRLFRDNVHRTWLMNTCATSKCHGGEEAGTLYLTNRNPASDRSAYTNFLIMERYRTTQGLPLINYNEPSKSPLLQYGLPRERAAFKHPEAGGQARRWTPAFTGEEDPRFRAAVEWIESMYDQRPDYPIEYKAPVPGPLKAAENVAEPDAAKKPR
ncbi:MAG: hypothetical protein U0640_09180 [Phycisphaerales bacterium]